MAANLNVGSHFRSYYYNYLYIYIILHYVIYYYKSETFLMPNYFQKIIREIVSKKIFLNQIAAVLELAAITLKMETYQALLSTYRYRFSAMLPAFNKKV